MKLSIALFALAVTLAIPFSVHADEGYRYDTINGILYKIPDSAKAGVDFIRDKDQPWVIRIPEGSRLVPITPVKVGQNLSPDPLGVFGERNSAKAAPSFQFASDNSLNGGAASAQ